MYGEKVEITLNVCAAEIERILKARGILKRGDGSQDSNSSPVAVKPSDVAIVRLFSKTMPRSPNSYEMEGNIQDT